MLLTLQKYNLQEQYKPGVEIHIADSRTFKDNKGEEKQEQDASTSQEDDMNILATEDMEHVDSLEFTRPTICENLRAHKALQAASSGNDDFSWTTRH